MPLINVKMVKVPASDLKRNDVFTTVLRGDGPLLVVTGKDRKTGDTLAVPFDRLDSTPQPYVATQTVRKVDGVKRTA